MSKLRSITRVKCLVEQEKHFDKNSYTILKEIFPSNIKTFEAEVRFYCHLKWWNIMNGSEFAMASKNYSHNHSKSTENRHSMVIK